MKLSSNNQACSLISYIQIEKATETEPEKRFIGDLSEEFGFILKQDGQPTINIQMSKDEMVSLIRNTIDYLLPEFYFAEK